MNSTAMDAVDIDTLKKESLSRARAAWQDIIDRLSSLSESQQGDTIDLRTGEIIKDTGHLRSLKVNKDDLWASFPSNSPSDTEYETRQTQKIKTNKNKIASNAIPKDIQIIDLSKSPRAKPQTHHSQPGDTSYIVSSSQHMTRSKVVGDDELIVKATSDMAAKKIKNLSKHSKHRMKKRLGLLDEQADDPLNMLAHRIDIETPSKVRRLRKALDQSYKHKDDDSDYKKRKHLHKLILQSKCSAKG